MLLSNNEHRYGAVTKLLHWSIALLIIGLIWLGWYMVDLGYYDPWYHTSLTAHKALGMLVLAVAVIKILWTLSQRRPDFVATIKPWEKTSALMAHKALFVLMLLIPITGYIISTSAGDPISFFDWFDIPALLDADDQLRDWAIELHYYLAYGGAGLIAVHALAALKHHFINRDGTLRKML